MDLKDKLDLLWKYLLLAVVVFGIFMIAQRSHLYQAHRSHGFYGMPYMGKGDMSMSNTGLGHAANVKVEKQITNGDTTVMVWVNGEKIANPEEFLEKNMHQFNSEDHDVMIWEGGHGKTMKKKVIVKVHKDDD